MATYGPANAKPSLHRAEVHRSHRSPRSLGLESATMKLSLDLIRLKRGKELNLAIYDNLHNAAVRAGVPNVDVVRAASRRAVYIAQC